MQLLSKSKSSVSFFLLQKPQGDILGRDLEEITELSLADQYLYDSADLRYFVNLEKLDLSGNYIDELSALSELSKLKTLDLSKNKITELSGLENLTNLQTLDLSNNEIEEVAALSDLTAVEDLNLADNRIEDISPLAALVNLKKLDIGQQEVDRNSSHDYKTYLCNNIRDLSALASLTALEWLNLDRTVATDLSPVSQLPALKHLSLHDALHITYFLPIGKMAALEELDISGTQFSDASILESCTALTSLNLRKTNIEDPSPLPRLANLQVLNIADTALVPESESQIEFWYSMSPDDSPEEREEKQIVLSREDALVKSLRSLTNLQELTMESDNWSWLPSLQKLENLSVCNTYQTDELLQYLDQMTQLKELDLSEMINCSGEFQFLSSFTQLEKLNLSGCSATDGFDFLSSMQNLRELDLSETNIERLPPFAPDCPLEKINLSITPIADVQSLSGLQQLTELDLSMCHNLTDCSSIAGLTSLKKVSVHACPLATLDAFSGLSNLEVLDIGGVDATDLSPISPLAFLKELNIDYIPCFDLSALSTLKDLEVLELNHGRLADFSESDDLVPTVDLASLQTLQNLRRLDMHDVTILDFGPLAALTRLNSLTIRDLISNAPETFCGPENLKQLTITLDTLDRLRYVPNIREVDFYLSSEDQWNVYGDPDPISSETLQALQKLRVLHMLSISPADMEQLSKLPELHELYWDTFCSGSHWLKDFPTLRKLKFPMATSKNIEQLGQIRGLRELDIAKGDSLASFKLKSHVTDISPLANLSELRSLNIGINEVKDFSCLANLPKLKILNAPYNGAETLGTDIGFGSLRYCNLDGCHLTDLTPFTGNTNLQYLNISNHQLEDISPLAGLSGLEILLARAEDPNALPDLPSFSNLTALREIVL